VLDPQFTIQGVNQAFALAAGLEMRPGDYPGKPFFALFPDPGLEEVFHQALAAGEMRGAVGVALRHFRGASDGPFSWDWNLKPIQDTRAQVTHLILEICDVTEREETRRALQETQAQFQRLFESTPEASLVIDEQGRIADLNQPAEELFGYLRAELLGQPLDILIPKSKRQRHAGFRAEEAALPSAPPPEPGAAIPHADRRALLARRKDGRQVQVEVTLHLPHAGSKRSMLSLVRQAGDLGVREREATAQTELVHLLHDVAMAANEADTITSAFRFTINRLCKFLSWPLGHALIMEEDHVLSPTNIWCEELEERFLVFQAVSDSLRYPAGSGLLGLAIDAHQPVWLTDLPNNPTFRRSNEARQGSLNTGLAIPVMANREVVGALEFFTEEALPVDPGLLAVLPHIGIQLGRVVERKRGEEALRKTAAQLRMVITNLPLVLFVVDRSMKLILLDGKGAAVAGLDTDRLVGRSIYERLARRPDLLELFEHALAGDEIHTEIKMENGATFEAFFTPYYDVNWAIDGVIGLAFDVDQRKRMEAELDEMKHRLLESVEQERSRLGQLLHDGPLQDLYGAYYQIQEAKNQLPPEDREVVDRALQTIQQVNATLRVICGELRPSTLVHLGLRKAILSHYDHLQERLGNTEIYLDLDEDSRELPYNRRLGLFRVYQQLVSNAIRHASASHIWIRLRLLADRVILEVQDDGAGFELPQTWIEPVRSGQFGLASALERIQAMQGEMEITTSPGEGTLARAVVPRG
jgi:PAS domain S-box-containing protein